MYRAKFYASPNPTTEKIKQHENNKTTNLTTPPTKVIKELGMALSTQNGGFGIEQFINIS